MEQLVKLFTPEDSRVVIEYKDALGSILQLRVESQSKSFVVELTSEQSNAIRSWASDELLL